MPNTRKHKKFPNRQQDSIRWLTTDDDKIGRRRARGATEAFQIEPLPLGDDFFGIYQVGSDGGQTYRIEIRSLADLVNSCNCPDHRIIGITLTKRMAQLYLRKAV